MVLGEWLVCARKLAVSLEEQVESVPVAPVESDIRRFAMMRERLGAYSGHIVETAQRRGLG